MSYNRQERGVDILLMAILVVIALISSALIYKNHAIFFGYSIVYLETAYNYARGLGLFYRTPFHQVTYLYSPMTVFAPFYVFLVSAIMKVFDLGAIEAAKIASLLSYILTAVPTYLIVKKIFRSSYTAFISTLLIILSLPVIANSAYALAESTYHLMILWAILSYLYFLDKTTVFRALLVGILAGLVVTTKYVGQDILPIFFLFMIIPSLIERQSIFRKIFFSVRSAILFTLGCLLTLGPVLYRNIYYTGHLFGHDRMPSHGSVLGFLHEGGNYLISNFYQPAYQHSLFNIDIKHWVNFLDYLGLFALALPGILYLITYFKTSKRQLDLSCADYPKESQAESYQVKAVKQFGQSSRYPLGFLLIYFLTIFSLMFTAYSFAIYQNDGFGPRFMTVIYLLLMLILPGSIYLTLKGADDKLGKKLISQALFGVLIFFICLNQFKMIAFFHKNPLHLEEEKVLKSQTYRWLVNNTNKDDFIITNEPYIIEITHGNNGFYPYGNKYKELITADAMEPLIERFCAKYLIYFYDQNQTYEPPRPSWQFLQQQIQADRSKSLKIEAAFDDGFIISFNPKNKHFSQCGQKIIKYEASKPKFESIKL